MVLSCSPSAEEIEKRGEGSMTPQQMLEQNIENAWILFNEIVSQEEEVGFNDAELSLDRKRAEGYAEGLAYAYRLIYGEEFSPKFEINWVD